MQEYDFTWVNDSETLKKECELLEKESWLSIDLEADNQHLYVERICLFQVTSEKGNHVIDPLTIEDLNPFLNLLTNKNIIKIFHDLEFDLKVINKEFKIQPLNLWDTKLAAEFCSEPKVSLSALLQKHFDILSDKSHQKANWTIRPIEKSMLTYSVMDSYYLKNLKDLLNETLVSSNRIKWFEEELKIKENYLYIESDQPEYFRIKSSEKLKGHKLNLLKELCEIRDKIAKNLEVSKYQIASNKNIMQLCHTYPKKFIKSNLEKMLKNKYYESFVEEYYQVVKKISKSTPLVHPSKNKPDIPFYKSNMNQIKAWRNEKATKLELPTHIVLSGDTIHNLIINHKNINKTEDLININGFRNWQLEEFGQNLYHNVIKKLKS